MKDVWILAIPAEWEALTPDNGNPDFPGEPFSYAWSIAKTGRWKSSGAFEVYNTLGSEEDIQEIVDALPSTDTVYAWEQGPGLDSLDAWPTDPAPVLALMNDLPVYDEQAEVVGTVPATYEAPNWGHAFFGQSTRIFAGEFSDEFSEEFL